MEAHFTIEGKEVPFSVTKLEGKYYLISSDDFYRDKKYSLGNDEGLLTLNVNPFDEDDEVVNEKLQGLSSQIIENTSEFEIESPSIKIKPNYTPDQIFVENKPFSLMQIMELINSKDIEMTPDFQRNFVWDKTRQSKLIESILLGLPLPSIYLSQYDDGKLTIVDGLQRITTIKNFLEDKLKLTGLEYLTICNDKKYSELDAVLSPLRLRIFRQTQIMCFVIDYRSPSQLKFDLFRRLNTGGKPLNNPEVRNCLSKPFITLLLKKIVEKESIKNTTSMTLKKDKRMEFRDSLLRYIYFHEILDINSDKIIEKYNGDIEQTLDTFVDELNNRNPKSLDHFEILYDNTMQTIYQLYGELAFRKLLPIFFDESSKKSKGPINRAIMLALTVLISKYFSNIEHKKYDFGFLIHKQAFWINENKKLFDALTTGTNSKSNLEIAFTEFYRFLKENLK